MVKAVVSRGEIRPLEPLPADWPEGQPLRVDKVDDDEPLVEAIDRDFAVLARLCEASDPADEGQLDRALHEARRQAKDQVRRQMGGRLPGTGPALDLVEQNSVMEPGDWCSSLLHHCLLRPGLGEGPHLLWSRSLRDQSRCGPNSWASASQPVARTPTAVGYG